MLATQEMLYCIWQPIESNVAPLLWLVPGLDCIKRHLPLLTLPADLVIIFNEAVHPFVKAPLGLPILSKLLPHKGHTLELCVQSLFCQLCPDFLLPVIPSKAQQVHIVVNHQDVQCHQVISGDVVFQPDGVVGRGL